MNIKEKLHYIICHFYFIFPLFFSSKKKKKFIAYYAKAASFHLVVFIVRHQLHSISQIGSGEKEKNVY